MSRQDVFYVNVLILTAFLFVCTQQCAPMDFSGSIRMLPYESVRASLAMLQIIHSMNHLDPMWAQQATHSTALPHPSLQPAMVEAHLEHLSRKGVPRAHASLTSTQVAMQ